MSEMEPSNGDHMAEDQPTPAASAAEEPAMDVDTGGERRSAAALVGLLRGFLAVQQRRAEAYSMLRRYRRRSPARPSRPGSSELYINPNDHTRDFWWRVKDCVVL
jgi:hypothetical protein